MTPMGPCASARGACLNSPSCTVMSKPVDLGRRMSSAAAPKAKAWAIAAVAKAGKRRRPDKDDCPSILSNSLRVLDCSSHGCAHALFDARPTAGQQKASEFERGPPVVRTPGDAPDMAQIGDGEARRGALGIEDTGVASAGERGHEGRVSLTERTFLLGGGRLARRGWIVAARRAAVARHVERDRAGLPRQRQGRRLRDDVPGNERRKEKYPDQRECAPPASGAYGSPPTPCPDNRHAPSGGKAGCGATVTCRSDVPL